MFSTIAMMMIAAIVIYNRKVNAVPSSFNSSAHDFVQYYIGFWIHFTNDDNNITSSEELYDGPLPETQR